MLGTIKTLKNGFGFITPEGTMGKDLFFHASGVLGEFNDLREGDMVEFEEVPSERGGMKAANVAKAQRGAAKSDMAEPAAMDAEEPAEADTEM